MKMKEQLGAIAEYCTLSFMRSISMCSVLCVCILCVGRVFMLYVREWTTLTSDCLHLCLKYTAHNDDIGNPFYLLLEKKRS